MGLSRRPVYEGVQAIGDPAVGDGELLVEVARAFEVNPSVLHRWRREFRQGPGNVWFCQLGLAPFDHLIWPPLSY